MWSLSFSPFHDRPQASDWHWLAYSQAIPIINKPASHLNMAIRSSSALAAADVPPAAVTTNEAA